MIFILVLAELECAIGTELRDHDPLPAVPLIPLNLRRVNPARHLPLHRTSQLSAKRFGALFAFQRTMDLDQFVETGVEIDSKFARELVFTIFNPKTSPHDGGIILRHGCVIPVSQRELSDRIHRGLHKNSLSDFLFRNGSRIAGHEDEILSKSKNFWKLIEEGERARPV
jgi:hypothetical protein